MTLRERAGTTDIVTVVVGRAAAVRNMDFKRDSVAVAGTITKRDPQ